MVWPRIDEKAPGTWGSLGGVITGLILYALGGTGVLVQGIMIILVAGWWAAEKIEQETEIEDNQIIVVDEVAGQCIAMLAAGGNLLFILISFVLFRIFDIIKPWPVSWCQDELPGAYGVMADDVAAGIYAFLFLLGMRLAGLG